MIVSVLAIVILISSLAWFGISAAIRAHNEKVHAEQQAELSSEISTIQSVPVASDVSNETLETLKNQTLTAYTTDPETGDIIYTQNESADQAKWFLDHLQDYNEEMLVYYLGNPERFEFVKAWPQRDQYMTPPEKLDVSLDEVPALIQWSLDWGYLPYGDSTVFYAGCAPTCLSMVLSYLKQDPTITPVVLKEYAEQNGYYVPDAGTAHALLDDIGELYGVNDIRIPVDQETVHQALSDGKILIFNMVPGNFTTVGHFIVVTGEKDGKIVVHDPNNIGRTEKLWSYEEVLPETANIWSFWN